MNCPSCKGKGFIDNQNYCCFECHGRKRMTFHEHMKFCLRECLVLNERGNADASMDEMNDRCINIVEREFMIHRKKRLPVLKRYSEENQVSKDYSSYDVKIFYVNQFKEKVRL